MRSLWTLLLVVVAVTIKGEDYYRVCYTTGLSTPLLHNWAQYRPEGAKIYPEDIEPFLCTHIMYAFARIDPATHKIAMNKWNDDQIYTRVNNLKTKNPALKTLLAVGGYKHESGSVSPFSQMVQSAATRRIFIDSAISLLRLYNFDGLDVDWEYPGNRWNSLPHDKQLFTVLCEELLNAFKREAAQSGTPRLLVTVAVAAGVETINKAYEISKLAGILDFISLMAYDLHGGWDPVTGHHTALEGPPGDQLTVSYALQYWIDQRHISEYTGCYNFASVLNYLTTSPQGMPCKKVALGLATYGRSFKLKNPENTGLGAPADGNGTPGEYTRNYGILSYYEICRKPGLIVVHDNAAKAPYGFAGDQWVGFDDEASLVRKVENLIKGKNLLGAMFWTLDFDDFKGTFCGKGSYPLIKAVKQALSGGTTNWNRQRATADDRYTFDHANPRRVGRR